MADKVSRKNRSHIMAQVKSTNTLPEIAVRSLLHRMGFRFTLHNERLPGKPDICLPKYRTVIFVHGCFWHRHRGCKRATTPTSNTAYWSQKFSRNIARDKKNARLLTRQGWNVILVWECQLKNPERLAKKVKLALKRNS